MKNVFNHNQQFSTINDILNNEIQSVIWSLLGYVYLINIDLISIW